MKKRLVGAVVAVTGYIVLGPKLVCACMPPAVASDVVAGDLLTLQAALNGYFADVGEYPSQIQGLLQRPAGVTGWAGPYLDIARPRDPWGYPYHYRRYVDGYVLQTLGADSRPGGHGASGDVRVKIGVSDQPLITLTAAQ